MSTQTEEQATKPQPAETEKSKTKKSPKARSASRAGGSTAAAAKARPRKPAPGRGGRTKASGKGRAGGTAGRKGSRTAAASASRSPRLRPGELDGIVLAYMNEHPDQLPMTAGTVARATNRSSGAVGNCLERLCKGEAPRVRRSGRKPRAYTPVESPAS